jgi:hypothetical protein
MRERNIRRNKRKCNTAFHTKTELHDDKAGSVRCGYAKEYLSPCELHNQIIIDPSTTNPEM